MLIFNDEQVGKITLGDGTHFPPRNNEMKLVFKKIEVQEQENLSLNADNDLKYIKSGSKEIIEFYGDENEQLKKEILEIYDDATHQNPTSQIDDSENKIIDDNSESSKVNEQLSEIQVEADDQQEQSDDSPPPEKNSKPLRVNKPVKNFD
ncbi:hypothetical protein F8M41_022936 [Gigaspora margarita]|uniref:Uncharacterized protein n=1 Tax=Gigaspora margarita TaxID=4874 RepID=A0A8H4EHP2_GIGMA|nr:hypothetical protein F8M41_022936 [Gigaspora margarita]